MEELEVTNRLTWLIEMHRAKLTSQGRKGRGKSGKLLASEIADDLAAYCGVSTASIKRVQSGHGASLTVCLKISNFFECSVNDIFTTTFEVNEFGTQVPVYGVHGERRILDPSDVI